MKNRLLQASFAACLTLGVLGATFPMDAQGQQQPALVIQGGTLIDGNGGAPMANSVVVVQGNRITAVGTAGQVQVPAGAQVIDAAGKWVLPGLMDAKSNWYWEYGEPILHWGVTSAMVSGGRHDIGTATRDAINHGIFPGPRLFETYLTLNGKGPDGALPDSDTRGAGAVRVGTPEEAVEWVHNVIEGGADFVTFGNGDGPPEVWAPAVAEAQQMGKAVIFRAMGPQTRAREVCEMGDGIVYIHTGNIGSQIAADESQWADYIGLPPDAYSDMDDAKADAMIEQLLGCNAYLEPDLMAADRGFHRNWARVQQEDHEFLNNEELRAYYPIHSYAGVIENHKSPETYLNPEALERRAAGFANHVAFLKRYVDAGGKIVAASDNPQSHPGLGLHQEITAYVEDIGLTPMQAIQSATKWVAEGFGTPDLGVIETGKLADILIVNADPLQDIKNLRQVNTVVLDGKVIDRGYHPWYRGYMFANSRLNREWSIVGDAAWARSLKDATWRPNSRNGGWGNTGGIDTERTPTPGIEMIFPYVLQRGSEATELTVTGFNFIDRSQVFIDGNPVPAEVMNRTELKVTVPANTLASAGKHEIVVKNPGPLASPLWGDTSNPAFLLVPFEFTTAGSWNRF